MTLSQNINGKQFGRTYHFDKVFGPDTVQERLYDSAISGIVDEVLQGFNCTIFAYGQTGTGKTYTMTGDIATVSEEAMQQGMAVGAGVIPRAVAQIFTYLEEIGGSTEYTVKCSFLELYNEEITDLLYLGSEPPKVRLMEDRSGVVVQGLEEPHVKNSSDVFGLLETGNARRRTAETLLNKQSSRSHSVFIITVSVREVLAEGEEVIRVGKLYLVDLAGSENVSRSGAVDQRAKEAGNINKSLLTLGRVITALVEGQGHVPYRDSKLTRLLRDSLGGKTKTCIIATIAPTVQCQDETLSTLDYAHRAKNIKNKPELNQKISKTTHLKELAVEIAKLKAELVATREKNGVFLPPAQYEEECEERKRLAARVEELEEDAATVSSRHEQEKAALVEEWEERVTNVQRQLDDTRDKLQETEIELENAKVTILQRECVLTAHKEAEQALAQHANHLIDELESTNNDAKRLFRRVDVKDEIEATNYKLIQALKNNILKQLSVLSSGIDDAATTVIASRSQRIARTLTGMLDRKATTDAGLQDQLTQLQGCIDALLASANAGLQNVVTTSSERLEHFSANERKFLKSTQHAAKEASKNLQQVIKSFKASADNEREAMEAWMARYTLCMDSLWKETQELVGAVDTALRTAKTEIEAAHAASRKASKAATKVADGLASKSMSTLGDQGQQAIIQEVTALIVGHMNRAKQDIDDGVTAIKTCVLEAQGAEAEKCIQQASTTIDSTINTVLPDAAALAKQRQDEQAANLKSMWESEIVLASKSTLDTGTAVGDAAGIAFNTMAEAVRNHVEKTVQGLPEAVQQVQTALQDASEACEKHAQEAASCRGEVCQQMVSDLKADQRELSALQADGVEGLRTDWKTFEGAQTAGIQRATTEIHEALDDPPAGKYAVDCDRADVPPDSCRHRQVPTKASILALRAPPAEDLLRELNMGAERTEDKVMMDGNGGMGTSAHGEDKHCDEALQGEKGDGQNNQHEAPDEVPLAPADAKLEDSGKENRRVTSRRKRPLSATEKDQVEQLDASPSKLRAAFKRGERRRATRQAN